MKKRKVRTLFDFLNKKRFVMISGKGGTGKTTTAASIAVKFAEDGYKTIVISLDPAHSLGDALMMEIGPQIRKVEKVNGSLYALEFDPKMLFESEREKLKKAMESDQLDIMGGPIPNEMFEFMLDTNYMPIEFAEGVGFLRLVNNLADSDFDKIVFDTAPTGHTLKLLELPSYLDSFIGKLIKFQLRVSSIFNTFKKFLGFGSDRDVAKETLRLLEELKEVIQQTKMIMTDESKSEFIVTTLPLAMSIFESARLVGELDAYGIPNHFIVVNMVRIYSGECVFSRNLSKMHMRYLQEIIDMFKDKNIRVIPFFSNEIRGVEMHRKVISYLTDFTAEKALDAIKSGVIID